MAASTMMQQNFDFPRAFNHNRIFKTKKNDVTGCHDLRYLLEAQSKGLIVAAVVKLPTDDLPKGVYKILLTCRSDVQLPNNDPRRRQREEEQPHVISNDLAVWERVRCTSCDCISQQSGARSSIAECKRLGILFKFEPIVKTVYDPAVWPDERLADYCLKAYKESRSMGRSKTTDGVTHWEGTFTEDGNDYWMGGFVKDSKITNFYFCHPDDRVLHRVA